MIILIGNKADLEAQRDVTYEEAKQFAEENGVFFFSFLSHCFLCDNDIYQGWGFTLITNSHLQSNIVMCMNSCGASAWINSIILALEIGLCIDDAPTSS